MSDDDTTLTLLARGPAAVVTDHDPDDSDLTVTETRETELDATVDLDTETLDSLGSASKSGAILRARDVAEHVADTLSDETRTYRVGHDRHDEWALILSGRVGDWLEIGVATAQDCITVGSDDKVANLACQIIDDLREYDHTNRALLAMLDLVGQYDLADYSKDGLLEELADAPAEGSDLPAEGVAGDD